MPSSSSSVETDSPPEGRRQPKPSLSSPENITNKSCPDDDLQRRPRTYSLDSQEVESEESGTLDPTRRKMDSLNVSPHPIRYYGIPLGTPAAKEAAKSFWTMEQLKTSLDKIAQFTSEDTGSSLSSLGSSIESESLTFASSGPSTPANSRPSFSISLTPHLTGSAPASPLASSRSLGTASETPSPLLLTTKRRGDVAVSLPGSLPSSPRLSTTPHGGRPRSHPFLSADVSRRLSGDNPRVNSAAGKRQELKTSLSVEGKQIQLASRNSSPSLSSLTSPTHVPLRSASYGGTISPDDGFHE